MCGSQVESIADSCGKVMWMHLLGSCGAASAPGIGVKMEVKLHHASVESCHIKKVVKDLIIPLVGLSQ